MELRFRVTRGRVALFAAAAALVATGSIGWAAIGDGGTVHGCVASNGAIGAVDPAAPGCRDRQTSVEWYTKSGADAKFATTSDLSASYLGINGKAADSDRLDGLDSSAFLRADAATRAEWATAMPQTTSIDSAWPTWTTVAHTTLPPGRYVVFARANALQSEAVVGGSVQIARMFCELDADDAQLDLVELGPAHPFGTFGYAGESRTGVSLQGAASSANPIAVTLRCTKVMASTADLSVSRANFVSMTVGSINTTSAVTP